MQPTFNVTVTEHPYGAIIAISGDLDCDLVVRAHCGRLPIVWGGEGRQARRQGRRVKPSKTTRTVHLP
ncbi:hypothetical protein [Streptomyces sp. NPDC057910]|uniref:hypothetical protein n=1 Tax=Streptomyces sp. NPDC057910 TaxID=3346278 RepID=UPI0036E0CB1E